MKTYRREISEGKFKRIKALPMKQTQSFTFHTATHKHIRTALSGYGEIVDKIYMYQGFMYVQLRSNSWVNIPDKVCEHCNHRTKMVRSQVSKMSYVRLKIREQIEYRMDYGYY